MIYLNDHISIVGKFIPDIYLAANLKDFLDSREDIPRPSRLNMTIPYLIGGDRAVKLLRNKVGILVSNVDVTPKNVSAVRFEEPNELEESLREELSSLAIIIFSQIRQITQVKDLSGSVYCDSLSSKTVRLDGTRISQREIEAGRYAQVSLLYDVATKTQEIAELTRNGPPIKDPSKSKEKFSLRDLVAAGGFA